MIYRYVPCFQLFSPYFEEKNPFLRLLKPKKQQQQQQPQPQQQQQQFDNYGTMPLDFNIHPAKQRHH